MPSLIKHVLFEPGTLLLKAEVRQHKSAQIVDK